MDINYHYFAVKTIAVKAGFQEADAQRIAVYSQFVDDFNKFSYMAIKDVPSYALHLTLKRIGSMWIFNPVTTGFVDKFDMAKLVLERYQKLIVIPFHFIPQNAKLIHPVTSRAAWRVSPARLEEVSLIQQCLLRAKDLYRKSADKQLALMKIGMVLHTFADTYAHQQFSGFRGWENHSKLMKVTDNAGRSDITSEYDPGFYFQLPSIGHSNVNHAPDDSNVSFEMSQKMNEGDDEYSAQYQRNNTREFLLVSLEILNYLRQCLNKPPVSSADWDVFAGQLTVGLLTKQKDTLPLCRHWNRIFGIQYSYTPPYEDKNFVIKEEQQVDSQLLQALKDQANDDSLEIENNYFSAPNDDFFRYNVFAEEHRTFVNGIPFKDECWDDFTKNVDKMDLGKFEKE